LSPLTFRWRLSTCLLMRWAWKPALGDAMATGGDQAAGGQVRAHNDEDDEERDQLRDRTARLRIDNVGELATPVFRSAESIANSRGKQIDHLLSNEAVRDWCLDEARATRAKVLSGKFVQQAEKDKSRYCPKEFATDNDPGVFAAASDADNPIHGRPLCGEERLPDVVLRGRCGFLAG
jgi:hypothetical protein